MYAIQAVKYLASRHMDDDSGVQKQRVRWSSSRGQTMKRKRNMQLPREVKCWKIHKIAGHISIRTYTHTHNMSVLQDHLH